MLNMLICDDEKEILEQYRSYLEQFQQENGIGIQAEFASSVLWVDKADYSRYQIFLLDIEIGADSGIQLARRIREKNEKGIIIFSTNFLEYALEGYEVRAFRYLKKPFDYRYFASVLLDATEEAKKLEPAFLTLRCGYEIERLCLDDILCCETERDHLKITMKDGSCHFANIGIDEMEKNVAGHDFCRCHRAYLINCFYIQNQTKLEIRMTNGMMIPISKYRKKEVMTQLMKYWGNRFL
ncbi:MAG: response regulator transcription factor [Oscillospiraceae bacterium]|nr:response regulator transcription factor [Oscillospiraceae bacterium]